jgi:hypothetical protein
MAPTDPETEDRELSVGVVADAFHRGGGRGDARSELILIDGVDLLLDLVGQLAGVLVAVLRGHTAVCVCLGCHGRQAPRLDVSEGRAAISPHPAGFLSGQQPDREGFDQGASSASPRRSRKIMDRAME